MAIPLMDIISIIFIATGYIQTLVAVFSSDPVVPASLRSKHPELIGSCMTIILRNVGAVAGANAFHIHALIAVPGCDGIKAAASFRQGPALIRAAVAFPLVDISPIMRGYPGHIEAFSAVFCNNFISTAG